MKLEDFTSEMLTEIKDLKDLTKGELPLIAKEYINAQKVSAIAGLVAGGILFIVAAILAYKGVHFVSADRYSSSDSFGWYLSSGLVAGVGFLLTLFNGSNLLDVVMQPRRMAIKAITSLKE